MIISSIRCLGFWPVTAAQPTQLLGTPTSVVGIKQARHILPHGYPISVDGVATVDLRPMLPAGYLTSVDGDASLCGNTITSWWTTSISIVTLQSWVIPAGILTSQVIAANRVDIIHRGTLISAVIDHAGSDCDVFRRWIICKLSSHIYRRYSRKYELKNQNRFRWSCCFINQSEEQPM
jgi:hypothetical protein